MEFFGPGMGHFNGKIRYYITFKHFYLNQNTTEGEDGYTMPPDTNTYFLCRTLDNYLQSRPEDRKW